LQKNVSSYATWLHGTQTNVSGNISMLIMDGHGSLNHLIWLLT